MFSAESLRHRKGTERSDITKIRTEMHLRPREAEINATTSTPKSGTAGRLDGQSSGSRMEQIAAVAPPKNQTEAIKKSDRSTIAAVKYSAIDYSSVGNER